MLWAVAWEQTPCGSLPDDDEAIAGKLDMPLKQFSAAREKLLRGWYRAEDGRLYHSTLTERVLEMLEYRRKEAARRAGSRGRQHEDGGTPPFVPPVSRGTTTGHTRDDTASPGTGTGTGTTLPTVEKAARKRAARPPKRPMPEGFAVSDRVKAWAAEKGYGHLSEHLDAFKRKCEAKGYTYADWDAAFMEAVREDWAKLRGRTANGAAAPPESIVNGSVEKTAAFLAEQAAHQRTAPPPSVLALRSRARAA